MSNLPSALRQFLGGGGLLEGEDIRQRPSDFSGSNYCRADAIARPQTTAEVAQVLRLCHKYNRPVVALGGITGLVKGCVTQPGDIGLSLECMDQIEEVDTQNQTMTVQAGVPLQAVQEAAEAVGLMFPLDLGARGSATIGGNIATNAGGNRVLRFGMARQLILGLEAVLADGTVVTSLGKVLKDNSGYDLKQLFIGSEGTLGIITRAVLRLSPAPRSRDTALVAVQDFQSVVALLHQASSLLGGGLSSFEVMWHSFFHQIMTHSDKHRRPFDQEYPFYVLLEALGADPESDRSRFEKALSEFYREDLIADAVVAQSSKEIDALWAMRDDVEALFALYPLFLYDVSLPVDTIEHYLEQVTGALDKRWPQNRCVVFGHLGDGNIHLAIAVGSDREDIHQEVNAIVYGYLGQCNGVISAEHGIGLEKKPFLFVCRSDEEIALMKTLKRALDPKNILNPGKIISL